MLIMIFAFMSGVYSYRILDVSSKIIILLIALSFINERLANYCISRYNNSNIVYGVFSPIEVLLVCLYYNNSIDKFKNNKLGLYIGVAALLFGLVNYFWIQTPFKMNNFFLLLESLIVIGLSLYSFYRMLLADDSLVLTRFPHFWFTSIFLFFWTATFFIWGLYDYMTITLGVGRALIHSILLLINVLYYVGFGLVFLMYNKMQTVNGR